MNRLVLTMALDSATRRSPGILATVRALCIAFVLTLMALLPAADSVYCADGCADASRTQCGWQAGASAATDGCGLCRNGLAVSSPSPHLVPTQRIQPAPADRISSLVLTIARPIDQPPRRS
jgi:hypothetical protein